MCVVGPREFDDGSEEILPHHILGSLQEFKMEALARRNTQVGLWSWENAAVWHFSRGSVWCLQYLLMLPSTYQEQGRPEVWFSQPCHTRGEGLPSEKLHQQVLESCVQDQVTEGTIIQASSSLCTLLRVLGRS